jgi:hypothetical protein
MPIFGLVGKVSGKDWASPIDRFMGVSSAPRIEKTEEQRKAEFAKFFRSRCEQAPKIERPSNAAE